MPKPPNTRFYHLFHTRRYLNFSLMHSFRILSCLVCPLIQCNILIFATFNSFSSLLFTAQHSIPYNIAGLILVHQNFSISLSGTYFSITNNTLSTPPFHPPGFNPMIYAPILSPLELLSETIV